jgi:hypothetical protein
MRCHSILELKSYSVVLHGFGGWSACHHYPSLWEMWYTAEKLEMMALTSENTMAFYVPTQNSIVKN